MPDVPIIGANYSRDEIISMALGHISSVGAVTHILADAVRESPSFLQMSQHFGFILQETLQERSWAFLCTYLNDGTYKIYDDCAQRDHVRQYDNRDREKDCCGYREYCCNVCYLGREVLIRFKDQELRLLPEYFVYYLSTKLAARSIMAIKSDLSGKNYFDRFVVKNARAAAIAVENRRAGRKCYDLTLCCAAPRCCR